jgi:alpha-aminoadipic semialdehyde synthase
MSPSIGIRRETKSTWERRSPVTPDLVRQLVHTSGIDVLIQPSARRVFSDADYTRAGATMTTSLDDADIILGVKEIPPDLLRRDATYLFFSHVIKGQPANMPMLRRLIDLDCTLIDYEKIADDDGRRLVFFGRFAGLAGMIDTLWALGQRLAAEGMPTPFSDLKPAHEYDDLDAAKDAIRDVGERISAEGLPHELSPLVIGIAGYGNVAKGAREIIAELPNRELSPAQLLTVDHDAAGAHIIQTTFKEEHIVVPVEPSDEFDLQDYYANPERYRGDFARFLPHLSVLMNCNYWDERYPRLVSIDDLHRLYDGGSQPRFRVIGDLGCDIGGAIECTVTCTEPGDPVFIYDVGSDEARSSFTGDGPLVLAVDILPTELPVEASQEFAKALAPILPTLARTDFDRSFDELDAPPEIRRAIIVHRGRLTPDFRYLEEHLR